MKTRWKGNFVHCAIEYSLSILSVLDTKKIHAVKEAPKDDKEGDNDETKGFFGQEFYK
jgi:hypothetical protein